MTVPMWRVKRLDSTWRYHCTSGYFVYICSVMIQSYDISFKIELSFPGMWILFYEDGKHVSQEPETTTATTRHTRGTCLWPRNCHLSCTSISSHLVNGKIVANTMALLTSSKWDAILKCIQFLFYFFIFLKQNSQALYIRCSKTGLYHFQIIKLQQGEINFLIRLATF